MSNAYEKQVQETMKALERAKKDEKNYKIKYFQSVVDVARLELKLEVVCKAANIARELARKESDRKVRAQVKK